MSARTPPARTSAPSAKRKRPAVAASHPKSVLVKTWRDPRTGREYESRSQLRAAVQAWHRSVLRDFEELVRERTLGQSAWLQLPGETPLAYSRFRAYLSMPLTAQKKRSYKLLAPQLKLNPTVLEDMSAKYHWVLRAKLYDDHLMEEEELEFHRERRKAARRQARLGADMQSAAAKGLQHLREDPDRMASMAPMEILKMAESGQRVERLAYGDSTEVHDKRVQLVWEGPQPSWAPKQEEEAPTAQLDDGMTIEGER